MCYRPQINEAEETISGDILTHVHADGKAVSHAIEGSSAVENTFTTYISNIFLTDCSLHFLVFLVVLPVRPCGRFCALPRACERLIANDSYSNATACQD